MLSIIVRSDFLCCPPLTEVGGVCKNHFCTSGRLRELAGMCSCRSVALKGRRSPVGGGSTSSPRVETRGAELSSGEGVVWRVQGRRREERAWLTGQKVDGASEDVQFLGPITTSKCLEMESRSNTISVWYSLGDQFR